MATRSTRRAAHALSRHLVRVGREATLPGGCSHRRTLAWAEEPIPGGGPQEHRCGVCNGARLVCIHESETDDPYGVEVYCTWEYRCRVCGKYTTVHATDGC